MLYERRHMFHLLNKYINGRGGVRLCSAINRASQIPKFLLIDRYMMKLHFHVLLTYCLTILCLKAD